MRNFSYKEVELVSGYLKNKQELNETVTINAVYDRFEETGRIKAFNCDWKEGDEQKPHHFWDSDVAKWMEGAAYILARRRDDELERRVESLIDCIEANQGEDGYFNIYYTVCAGNALPIGMIMSFTAPAIFLRRRLLMLRRRAGSAFLS